MASPEGAGFLRKNSGNPHVLPLSKVSKEGNQQSLARLWKGKRSERDSKAGQGNLLSFLLDPLETIYFAANLFPFERFILRIKIEGKEHLDAALARGKGVIALGAHLGSFTLLGTRLAVEGYPFNLVVNVGRFPKLWGKLADYQGTVGQQTIPHPPSSELKGLLNSIDQDLAALVALRVGGTLVTFDALAVAFDLEDPTIDV